MIDPTKLEEMQTDQQLAAGPDAIARAHVDALRKNLHTALPGIIKSFDPAKQTAVVQIAIQKLFLGDEGEDELAGWVSVPPCGDVPVFFPGCKGFVMTYNPEEGDECLLVFSERAIDGWFKAGGVQQPTEYRLHDYSDGFAFVGFSSEPNAVGSVQAGAMELRTRDGATVVRLEPNLVTLGAAGAAQAAALGTATKTALDLIKTHTHGSNGGGPIVPSPELTAMITAVEASNVKVS